MKKTLLELVQSILSDMDSEGVNSISDSIEATQIASVVEDTYFNMISARVIPEHKELIKLAALSDSAYPTHFTYDNVKTTKQIEWLKYNIDTAGGVNYRPIYYVSPAAFLSINSYASTTTVIVVDKNAGTSLIVRNDTMPTYYTSFDDKFVVMDSYDSAVEATLQESKIQAYGTVYPTFSITDSFTPDINDTLFPYLLAEAKSTCFSLFKSGVDAKVEQTAKRLKAYVQNDQYKTKMENNRPNYGRR